MVRGIRNVPASDVIEQAGALCLRTSSDGVREMLLVGSRRTGRWGLPKGHIDPGETTHGAAAREAFEEAGVSGTVSDAILGSFVYSKDGSPNRYRVIVHVLEVEAVSDNYPERGIRNRAWFGTQQASASAGHEGLRDFIAKLAF